MQRGRAQAGLWETSTTGGAALGLLGRAAGKGRACPVSLCGQRRRGASGGRGINFLPGAPAVPCIDGWCLHCAVQWLVGVISGPLEFPNGARPVPGWHFPLPGGRVQTLVGCVCCGVSTRVVCQWCSVRARTASRPFLKPGVRGPARLWTLLATRRVRRDRSRT